MVETLLCVAFSLNGRRVCVLACMVEVVTFHRIFNTFSRRFHRFIKIVAGEDELKRA
jgi:hypothetical protein